MPHTRVLTPKLHRIVVPESVCNPGRLVQVTDVELVEIGQTPQSDVMIYSTKGHEDVQLKVICPFPIALREISVGNG